MLNLKPTAANLEQLRLEHTELFYQLDPTVEHLHLLLGKGREYKDSCDNAQPANMPLADAPDKTERLELLNAWVADLQSIADSIQPGEHLVLITGRSIEDAVYLYAAGEHHAPLLASLLSEYRNILEALNAQDASSHSSNQIQHVHVLLTECPEYSELLRVASRCITHQGIGYQQHCGTFFIDDELTQMLQACKKFCHAASVAL